MKITKSKLKQIIKEELQAVLAESPYNDQISQAFQDKAAKSQDRFLGRSVGEKIVSSFKVTPTGQRHLNHLKELESMIGDALRDNDRERAKNLHRQLKTDKVMGQIKRIPALKYLIKRLPIIGGLSIIAGGVFTIAFERFARAKTPEDYDKATEELVKAFKSQEGQDAITGLSGIGSIAQVVRDVLDYFADPHKGKRVNPSGKAMTMAQRKAALRKSAGLE